MRLRPLALATSSCAAVAASIASVPTYFDWQLNPGQIFRSQGVTRWSIVFETWLSWFAPTSVLLLAVWALVALLRHRLAARE